MIKRTIATIALVASAAFLFPLVYLADYCIRDRDGEYLLSFRPMSDRDADVGAAGLAQKRLCKVMSFYR